TFVVGADEVKFMFHSKNVMDRLRSWQIQLNSAIGDAVGTWLKKHPGYDLQTVPTQNAFAGHQICNGQDSGTWDFVGLQINADNEPKVESCHPRPAGNRKIADAVLASL